MSPRPPAVFIGTRVEAFEALRRFAQVTSIITTHGSWVHRRCGEDNPTVILTDRANKQDAFTHLRQCNGGLVLSVGFPFILPGDVLSSGGLYVNSHPSLLPAYKGINAIRAAHADGQTHMGVTVHYMVEDVDSGETIQQEGVSVEGMELGEIYSLLFGVVEPMAITRALEILFARGLLP